MLWMLIFVGWANAVEVVQPGLSTYESPDSTPPSFTLPEQMASGTGPHAKMCEAAYRGALGTPKHGALSIDISKVVDEARAHRFPANAEVALRKALGWVRDNPTKISEQRYVAVADYELPGNRKRFYVVDTQTGAFQTFYVGQGSGTHVKGDPSRSHCDKPPERWTSSKPYSHFSNKPDSCLSATGCVLVAPQIQTTKYWKKYTRVFGLESTNDNDCARDILLHNDPRKSFPGDSSGCFALRRRDSRRVLSMLAGGVICTNP